MSGPRKADYYLVYLSLGSNIQPKINLPKAVKLIRKYSKALACSTAWRTEAVGGKGPDFLNAALLVQTRKPPDILKKEVLEEIEAELGRVRTEDKNAPRTIDIDILVVNGEVIEPEIWTQAHIAVPLAEILREELRSISGKTLHDFSEQLLQANILEPHPEILLAQEFE